MVLSDSCFVRRFVITLYLVHQVIGQSNNTPEDRQLNLFNVLGTTSSTQKLQEKGNLASTFLQETIYNLTQCKTTNGRIGVCTKSSTECGNIGGVVGGNCTTLSTCCIIEAGCGGVTEMNNTYFVGPGSLGTGAGHCELHFKTRKDISICQIRLDFDEFILAPPTTREVGVNTRDGTCVVDKFDVAGRTNQITPLCGVNTGKNLYIQIDRGLKSDVVVAIKSLGEFAGRKWRIRISQIPCDADYKAPSHCNEYYTNITGTLTSHNYVIGRGTNQELLSAYQYICIRKEAGFCGICYTQCSPQNRATFSISGPITPELFSAPQPDCRNDFLFIRCFQFNDYNLFRGQTTCSANQVCGHTNFLTRCSPVEPFEVWHRSNAGEGNGENSEGFCLHYQQQPCHGRRG